MGGRDTGVSLFFTGRGILRNWSKVVFTSLTHLFMRRFRPRSHWAPRVVPGGSGEWARCGCSLADPAHWWGDRPLSLGLRDVAALLVRAGSEKVPERPAMGSAGVCRAAGRWGAGARRSPMAPGGRVVWRCGQRCCRRPGDCAGHVKEGEGARDMALETQKRWLHPAEQASVWGQQPAPASAGFRAWGRVRARVAAWPRGRVAVCSWLRVRALVAA